MPGCRQIALCEALSHGSGLPTFLENDTRASALAEKWFARERDFDNLLFVEIGEFLGAVFLVGGRIFRGAGDSAGELGHLSLDPRGEQCYCGGRGCLERMVSLHALLHRVQSELGGNVRSVLPRLIEAEGQLTVAVLRRALDAADKIALPAVADVCIPLGTGLANAINLLNPSHVIISGPFASLGDHLLRP